MKNSTTQNKSLAKLGSILVWIFVWQGLYMIVDKEILLVSPYTAFRTLFSFFSQGEFWWIVLNSLGRILLGYIVSVALGCLLAICAYKIEFIHILFSPLMSIIKATPVASFIILALVWIKTRYVPIFIVFLMVLPLVYKNMYEGMKTVDGKLLEMAKVYEFDGLKTARLIYFPHIMPFFISSATTALGFAWKSGIAAEVIATPSFSIGREIYNSKIYLDIPHLFAWTTAVILLSIIFEKILIFALEKAKKTIVKAGG